MGQTINSWHAPLSSASVRPWWLALLVLVWFAWAPPTLIQRLDLMAYDLASRVLPVPLAVDSVIVAIDERSLQSLGRWPWPRGIHADLLDRLRVAGVDAVAIDLLFNEPSPQPGDDRRLASAIAGFGPIVLPLAPIADKGGIRVLRPLPEFITGAAVLAHADVEIDRDAVARRLFLRGGVGGQYWDALPVAMWRIRTAGAAVPAVPSRDSRPVAEVSGRGAEAWVRDLEVLLPARGAEVPRVSYADVLADPALAATLAGKTVWVGVTAVGLGDRLSAASAPRGEQWSAVQWHAHAYESLRAGRLVTPVGAAWAWWLGGLPLGLMIVGSRLHGWLRNAAMPLLVAMPMVLAGVLLWRWSIWADVTAPALACAAGYLLWRTERDRHTRRALHRLRAHALTALRAINDAVVVVDVAGRVRYLNPVAAHLAGRPPEQAVGIAIENLYALPADDCRRLKDAVVECLSTRQSTRRGPPVQVASGGVDRLLMICASPVTDEQDGLEGAVLALSDITDVVSAGQQLQFEATHDSLTGLANRALLAERLAQAIVDARRSDRSVAVLFMDLDRFKRFNDSLGHRIGDSILKTVARRLLASCGSQDTVARWGGDEFVIVLAQVEGRDAAAAAAARLIDAVSRDVSLDGIDVHCTCSIGIAMAPQDSSDPDALLAMADAAMYRGKAQAGHRFEFYAAEMRAGSRQWLDIETQLRQALGRDEFELYYQPQVRVTDGRVVGLEALLRWRTASGELVSPGRFIGVAEESGLILPIGAWAIEAVSRQLQRWLADGIPSLPISINVSARQCLDRSLVKQVAAMLQRTGIPAGLIALEITETTAMADVEHVISLLDELRALGVGLAVDDFGIGHSSLAYLKRFPIDQIKIDQSFVRDITHDPNDAAIVRAAIAIGQGLGVPVVAEGVETEEQARFLAQHGCDIAQGFFYARPLDVGAATAFLAAQGGDEPTHRLPFYAIEPSALLPAQARGDSAGRTSSSTVSNP